MFWVGKNSGAHVNPFSTISGRWRQVLTGFKRDERGTVAMLFGMMAIVLVMLIGGAVDMGRWMHAYSETKAAVDASVLAGTRTLQVSGGDVSLALSTAKNFYKANTDGRTNVKGDTIDFKVDSTGHGIFATGTAYIDTPFLAVASIPRLVLWKDGGSDTSKAVTELGGGNGQKLEISVMLDTTGSMSGEKISDLKAAAKDLVNIVLSEGQSNVRVALAPFAESVRPGSAYLNRVRGSRPGSIKMYDKRGRLTTYSLTPCVSERSGADAYTDAAPDGANILGAVYSKNGSCTTSSEIVPLTSDKSELNSTIDGLTASGGTAGHLGTAWAWYLLSPKWSNVWDSASKPASYDDDGVKKIAILMTDGEYNTEYDTHGLMTSTNNTSPMNGPSDTQARTVCGQMKEAGIQVYTVGFGLDSSKAIETLQQCATDNTTAYLAQDGEQLRNVFRDIAVKLSPLHLTQ
ncbi:MAG: VWA domain-containing protein [Hyphomicrobiaceae bacterium]|nr:VWA domain-containing protein [Hyphomicrobiaceae bacterium]